MGDVKVGQTLGNSLSDVKVHALANTMADTLPKPKALKLSPHSTRCNHGNTARHWLKP